MKTIYKLGLLFGALALIGCQKDTHEYEPDHEEAIDETDGDITIVDGMIQGPEWLVLEMEKTGNRYQLSPGTGKPMYPLVCLVKYNEQDYILLVDLASSDFINGMMYFTLSGEYIDPGPYPFSDLYNNLQEARKENATLIWSNHTADRSSAKGESVFTRAMTLTSIYTPNGSLVPNTYIRDEEYDTPAEIAFMLDELLSGYPRASTSPNPYATILSNSTSRYNCHAYAWHMSEGGSPVWINSKPMIYVQDGSYYVATSDTPNAKVMYNSDDHSAIAETPDIFVSKWGRWPLMRHNKDYSPYNSSLLAYYAPPPVTISVSNSHELPRAVNVVVCDRKDWRYYNAFENDNNFTFDGVLDPGGSVSKTLRLPAGRDREYEFSAYSEMDGEIIDYRCTVTRSGYVDFEISGGGWGPYATSQWSVSSNLGGSVFRIPLQSHAAPLLKILRTAAAQRAEQLSEISEAL